MSAPCPACGEPLPIDDGALCPQCGAELVYRHGGVAGHVVTPVRVAPAAPSLEAAIRGRNEWQSKALEAVRMLDSKCAEAARIGRDAAYERASRAAEMMARQYEDPRVVEAVLRVGRTIRGMKGGE